jgi:tagaturonate reductase
MKKFTQRKGGQQAKVYPAADDFRRGNAALTLNIIVLDSILAQLVVPFSVSLLIGTEVHMDMTGIALSLILMVVIPTVAGILINEGSRGKAPPLVMPYLNPLSKVCLFLVIAANTAAAAPSIVLEPATFVMAVFAVVLVCAGYFIAKGAVVWFRLPAPEAASLLFTVGMRNITAAVTIAIAFFTPETAVPCLLGIVLQQTTAALMGKFLLVRSEKGEVRSD